MKEEFIDLCSIKKSILLLFGATIVVSILFCALLSINHALPIHAIDEYFYVGSEYKNLNYFITIFVKYLRKYMMVYILSSISVLFPVGITMFCIETFNYGFCITYLYILFGNIGVEKAIQSFGIQSLAIELLLLWGVNRVINERKKEIKCKKDKVIDFAVGVIICIFIGIYELINI